MLLVLCVCVVVFLQNGEQRQPAEQQRRDQTQEGSALDEGIRSADDPSVEARGPVKQERAAAHAVCARGAEQTSAQDSRFSTGVKERLAVGLAQHEALGATDGGVGVERGDIW